MCEDLKVIATDDIITTSKDEICIDLIPIDNIPVLDNDTSESENYDLVVSKLHFTGSHGLCEVTLDGKGVKYTPNDEFTGEDTCVYEVCDANEVRLNVILLRLLLQCSRVRMMLKQLMI